MGTDDAVGIELVPPRILLERLTPTGCGGQRGHRVALT
jgi:hypothetical protein